MGNSQPWRHIYEGGRDDGELRPWQYIYVYSIERRLIRRVAGRQAVRALRSSTHVALATEEPHPPTKCLLRVNPLGARCRRPQLVANRATLPQKCPPPPSRNVADTCELTLITKRRRPGSGASTQKQHSHRSSGGRRARTSRRARPISSGLSSATATGITNCISPGVNLKGFR